MKFIRTLKITNLVSAVLFLLIFAWQTYQQGAPAWRILIILAFFQAMFFFFTLPMLKKRVAEAEEEKRKKDELDRKRGY